jgi:hypothetical protein
MPDNSQNFFLRKAIIAPGESGYFSEPSQTLDPHLFTGDRLKPEVRLWLLQTLHTYLDSRWHQAASWANAWLAGSGISHQWAGARGNGDLDVLLGVDWPRFRQLNPGYEGLADRELATLINNQMKTELWPRTALTRFGNQSYEVTFFINLNSSDIRNIQPYAAYNLPTDTWTVRPPKLPQRPASMYPAAWKQRITSDLRLATQIIDRYNRAVDQAGAAAPNTGAWTNAMAMSRLAADQATALYDDIHLGRRAAFGEMGDGYADWHNYRWQSLKANGVVNALRDLAQNRSRELLRVQTRLYGRPLTTPEQSLISALTWRNT